MNLTIHLILLFDYSKQRIREVRRTIPKGKHKLTRNTEIFATCPDCRKDRWVLQNGLRRRMCTTLCRSCASKRRNLIGPNNPFWKKGIQYINGYRCIHTAILQSELSPSEFSLVKKHLSFHRSYHYEHRVVALLKYGPKAVAKGMVIRHLDGNKINNDPSNIAYGPQRDNVRDHTTDRHELQLWRGIALTLARLLIINHPNNKQ